jgi:serine/threonine-protein kinase
LLIFGKYEVLETLGRGGMAEVFRALSVGVAGFRRPVVIKRILPQLASNKQFVDMFIKEASIAASLDHPNIVQVFDLGQDEGDLFMVLEHVPGIDLGVMAQYYSDHGGGIPHELVAFVAVDVCKALECAHGQRDPRGRPRPVIHRDVSPQNVLLSVAGAVKLADFGLAMALGGTRATTPGIIKGKLGYMSPEQATGQRDLDIRSDLFSLGVVLHEALSGRRLFVGPTAAAIIQRVRSAQVPLLAEVAPSVPVVLAELVHSLLQQHRDDRPSSAQEVRRVLSRYLRTVQPPVDAGILAEAVRHVAESLSEGGGSDASDEVCTAAYLTQPGSPFAGEGAPGGEPSLDSTVRQPPEFLAPDDEAPTFPSPSDTEGVLVRRVVTIGDDDDQQ